jgi:hypothetical protein
MTTSYTFQIHVIKNQIEACLRAIANGVKSFVDRLVVLESQLEKLEGKVTQYTEAQIKEAFEAVGGCLKRYWKPEMTEIIPNLVGKGIVESSWDWMIKFPEVQKMEQLGWKDRVIGYAIDAANLLGK